MLLSLVQVAWKTTGADGLDNETLHQMRGHLGVQVREPLLLLGMQKE